VKKPYPLQKASKKPSKNQKAKSKKPAKIVFGFLPTLTTTSSSRNV